ncbi:MAG: RNA polymerase subunit sigma-24, partial [Sphingobacteriales bacterium]
MEVIKIDKREDALNPHEWVSKYADYLYSYAVFRINDGDLAKDLVQETFLAALERKGKFEGRSTEKTWLTAILKNKIVDIYRSRSTGLTQEVDAASDENFSDFFDNDGHWNDQHRPAEIG